VRGLEKRNVHHGVVSAIARPELQIVDRGRCGNQRVSQFNVMAFRVLSQVVSSALPNFGIDRDGMDRSKERFERGMLPWPGAVPEFGHGNGRA